MLFFNPFLSILLFDNFHYPLLKFADTFFCLFKPAFELLQWVFSFWLPYFQLQNFIWSFFRFSVSLMIFPFCSHIILLSFSTSSFSFWAFWDSCFKVFVLEICHEVFTENFCWCIFFFSFKWATLPYFFVCVCLFVAQWTFESNNMITL